MNPDSRLSGKNVVVTGASRGIGFAIAKLFLEKGANVVISSRSRENLNNACENLTVAEQATLLAIPMDVSDEKSVNDGFEEIFGIFNNVDILVNNAGIVVFKPVLDMTIEDWQVSLDVNLRSAFLCTQKVLPAMMKNRSGIIVNVSSVAGIKAFPGNSAYGAAKAGMIAFGNSLREEVRDEGIKVVNIIPGATDTSIWDGADPRFDRRMMIKPEDIAKVIIDVCSAENSIHYEEVVIRPQHGDF